MTFSRNTELSCEAKQETGRWVNRVENSHLPFRRRKAMLRFRRMKSLQKSASVHASFHNHFSQERHLVDGDLQTTPLDCADRVQNLTA